jgi:hypothetical protein
LCGLYVDLFVFAQRTADFGFCNGKTKLFSHGTLTQTDFEAKFWEKETTGSNNKYRALGFSFSFELLALLRTTPKLLLGQN